jgi:hypothetical protein
MITRNLLSACCFLLWLSACNLFSPETPGVTPRRTGPRHLHS